MPDLSLRRVLTHPATLFVTCVVLTIAGSVALWNQNSKHFLQSERYQLSPNRIHIDGDQSELASALKSDLLAQLEGSNANTLDTHLVGNVASFVESKPYVENVTVRKDASSLNLQANYRQPVGVIELGSLPVIVDRRGVVMDGRLYKSLTPDDLLRITINRPVNRGLESWEAWPDQRVAAAAKVCEEIADVWQELGIYRVVTYWDRNQAPNESLTFELWTKYGEGGKVIWSNVVEDSNDASAEEKIALLRQFVSEHGALQNLAGRNKLDVRSGTAKLEQDVRTAEQPLFLKRRFHQKRTASESTNPLLRSKLDR